MMTIDAAIDDYLHTIVRTRPWTKKREEELLEALSDWLYQQPEPRIRLPEIGPELVQQYARATELSTDDHRALLGALHNLYTWSIHAEAVEENPFAA